MASPSDNVAAAGASPGAVQGEGAEARSPAAVALGCAVAAGLVGALFLGGWLFASDAHGAWLGRRMKVNTSLCLCLVSAALALLTRPGARARVAARALAGLALVVASATVLEFVAGIDLHIDQLLARDVPASAESARFPGRMSPNAAVCLALFAFALQLAPSQRLGRALLAQALVLTAMAIGLLALVGYLFQASVLYQLTPYIRISPYTAAALEVLAVGVLALRRDLGLARLLISRGSGGYLTRPLILLAVVAPVLFGWLALAGQRLAYYDVNTGVALLVLATLGTFVFVIVVLARSMERLEGRRRQAEIELRQASELTAALARAATVDEVVAVTMRLGLPALGAASGGLLLASEDEQQLRMASAQGYAGVVVDQYLTLDARRELPATEALRTRRPVFVESPEENRRRYPSVPADQIRPSMSWAALPIQIGDRVLAVLGLSFSERQRFADAQRERLAGLAEQCGQALHRALLFDSEKRAHEREQRARQGAEDANRAKDEFLAMLGHELRNPLAPIMTALALMRMRGDGNHRKERDIVERQVQHMVRLVDDLLDVSRITRGKIELKRRRIDVADIVSKSVEVASPLLEERQHRLHVEAPRGIAVTGDEHRLTQVLSNLLTNAAKYTDHGGDVAVVVDSAPGGEEVRICVRDSGIGIAPELLPRVFDLFVQGQRTPERSGGGLGLGLSIVRRLVEMHGGRVTADSEGPGRGSSFTVHLPAEGAAADARVPSGESVAAAPAEVRAGRRILVVDDNRDAAEMLAEALGMGGHEVRVAFDGPSALELAPQFRPELAFLDIGLPVMDGYELAVRLRAAVRGPLALVAVTGYGQDADRVRSIEAGFDRHVVKPLQLDDALAIASDPPRRVPEARTDLAG